MNINEEEQIRVYSCALVVRFDSRKRRRHEPKRYWLHIALARDLNIAEINRLAASASPEEGIWPRLNENLVIGVRLRCYFSLNAKTAQNFRGAVRRRCDRGSYGVVVNVVSLPYLVPPLLVALIRKWYVVFPLNPLMLAATLWYVFPVLVREAVVCP